MSTIRSMTRRARPRHFGAFVIVLLSLNAVAERVSAPEGGHWDMVVCADPHAMPFSRSDGAGFENAIAALLAEHLEASLHVDWYPFTSDMIDLRLREGHCDILMGVPDGHEPLLTSVAYYRSPYVFVVRSESDFVIESLDDPRLSGTRIGLQDFGIPPHHSLTYRGLDANIVANYGAQRYAAREDPLADVVKAVIAGDIDVGVAWGPVGGYYALPYGGALTVVPVLPEIEVMPRFLSMVVPMTIGVRQGDDALRDRLSIAIAERWDEIQAILDSFGIPRTPTPRPLVRRSDP
jgi:mxaJ protein